MGVMTNDKSKDSGPGGAFLIFVLIYLLSIAGCGYIVKTHPNIRTLIFVITR